MCLLSHFPSSASNFHVGGKQSVWPIRSGNEFLRVPAWLWVLRENQEEDRRILLPRKDTPNLGRTWGELQHSPHKLGDPMSYIYIYILIYIYIHTYERSYLSTPILGGRFWILGLCFLEAPLSEPKMESEPCTAGFGFRMSLSAVIEFSSCLWETGF